jgi:hypothetical protein
MSRLTEALSCLSEIHTHLAKAEVYRGLKAKPVVLSGLAGLVAAMWQLRLVSPSDPVGFVWYWIAAAGLCGLIGCSGSLISYFLEDDDLARRRARIVAGQFVPCVVGGLFFTVALRSQLEHCIGLMPGLWAVLYGLGLFSARPYLPRATGWVALYFLTAGVLLISFLPVTVMPTAWSVGGVFCVGQIGLAWVLHRNERREVIDAW